MAKQYWVGEFYVDLSRNQISQLGQSQTLPPKALQVLTLLAENRGKVVSYDELLDTVWANSVVTPNTLQRCIAQLRKALGEDSKAQGIIKTHAKQGYSLECDVSWSVNTQPLGPEPKDEHHVQGDVQAPADTSAPDNTRASAAVTGAPEKKPRQYFWYLAIASALTALIGAFQFQHSEPQLAFGDIRYLTATDDKEHSATYSSDGRYILFHRYYEHLCLNNIWAKDAETLEEVQLTDQLGTYEGQTLSPDGKTLVFIKQEDCTKPVSQNFCFRLMSMDFQAALREPQSPTELLHCKNSKIKKPTWIDNTHLIMLQKEAQPWRLIRFSLEDKSTTVFYEFAGGSILHYAYSHERNLFVVTSMKDEGQQYIDILSGDGALISSHPITIPENVPRHTVVAPQFVPGSDKFIFGDGSNLYSLSRQGQISREDFRFDESAGAPYFHPDGNRLLMIKGRYDGDLARLPIHKAAETGQTGQRPELVAYERSFYSEDYGKLHPDGEQIAFASKKTGNMQIWLLTPEGTRVISAFPRGTRINNLFWNTAGTHLLIQANLELVRLSLDGEETLVYFHYPVIEVFHWDSDNHSVIANILVNGVRKFVEIDLSSGEYRAINDKFVSWAVKATDGSLIFTDHLDRFWQKRQGGVEDVLVEPLSEQGSLKRFVENNGRLFGINKSEQLWAYDLSSDEFNVVTDVPATIDYLTDANHQEILLTFVVAAKKEVVEVAVVNPGYTR